MTKKILTALCGLVMGLCCVANAQNANLYHGEDGYVERVAACRGKLYAMWSDGLYAYHLDEGSEVLVSDQVDPDLSILSDGHVLYGFHPEDMVLFRLIDEEGNWRSEAIFEWTAMRQGRWLEPMLMEERLVGLRADEGYSRGKKRIVSVGMESGIEADVSVEGIDEICGYKDGRCIALSHSRSDRGVYQYHLTDVDPHTGKQTTLAAIEGFRPEALAYDVAADEVYVASRDFIYVWQGPAGFSACTPLLSGDISGMIALGGGQIAVISDNWVLVRSVTPDQRREETTLVVYDPMGRGNSYASYVASHPDVSLVFSRDESVPGAKQFAEDVLTGSDAIDLYLLSDINMIKTIYHRGYGVELGQSEALRALLGDMYEPFQSALTREDRAYAFPKEVTVLGLSYNRAVFEAYNLPVPDTYGELFDLVIYWMDEYAGDHPEVIFDSFGFDSALDLRSLLARYADEMLGNGRDISFRRDGLKTTLQKYFAARARCAQYRDTVSIPQTTTHAFQFDFILQNDEEYEAVVLRFEPDNHPVIGGTDVDLEYFVVNPRSKHIAEALEFIASYEPDHASRLSLYRSQTPVLNPAYDGEMQLQQAQIDEIERAICEAEAGADTRTLERELFFAQAELAEYARRGKWLIEQRDIDAYRRYLPQIDLAAFNPFSAAFGDDDALLRQLEDGAKDIDTFLRELDNRIELVYREEGL